MTIASFFQNIGVYTWDLYLVVVNAVTPNRKTGRVVAEGCPGFGGKWPEYIPPKEGDSRSACPALNAMANHGILPRDGKNISFKELTAKVHETYNFAPSFCFFVPNYAAGFLKRDYSKDTFDLEELSLHNAIEHDGSVTRQDAHFNPDQSKPHLPFVEELLASASGKDTGGKPLLTVDDIARYSAKRRADAQANNPEFTLATIHRFFGSSNNATMLRIFGGKLDDLRVMLVEERIPEGWESFCRGRKGLTMASFNLTALKIENSTKRYGEGAAKKD
ncbi:aromatic peroxygenase [Moniliophthora roreri MCA 2997]|uniref:Aromatic peroxygenase n=1 Tax=Moniliophthora roreri (strain MCA 2997) TaxID=1381753 RepID=V2X6M8_MONRO|nr:aromatic peroxygenase [Moniliophthora roreri MCA 2997]